VYQLGNFIASANLNIQVMLAEGHANDYGLAMAIVVGIVAVVISVLVATGPERHGIAMAAAHRTPITAII
jgi:MFS transporter, SHS family, lactate transporter